MIGSVFWAAILGWQAAYAPTGAEKQKCYEAARNAGYKGEECKSFWEKVTSDPVAFFTLVLAVSTVGLWAATVFLYRAGERQFRHIRRSALIQSRDMQDSIAVAKRSAEASERTSRNQLRAFVFSKAIQQAANHFTNADGALYVKEWVFWAEIENVGATPATDVRVWAQYQVLSTDRDLQPYFVWRAAGPAMVMGPHMGGRSGYVPIPIDQMTASWLHEIEIYLGFRIEYRDILDPSILHHHEQCMLIELVRPPADVEDPNSKNAPRVNCRPYGTQNSTA